VSVSNVFIAKMADADCRLAFCSAHKLRKVVRPYSSRRRVAPRPLLCAGIRPHLTGHQTCPSLRQPAAVPATPSNILYIELRATPSRLAICVGFSPAAMAALI
jgi:hypothetical protein